MIISAIVATDLNNAIGKDNGLLCYLPADLKFFKATTMGCPVIMGRKTYDSMNGKLLPGRRNMIVTRNKNFNVEGAEVFNSVEEAISHCSEEKIFIIGGAEIFKQSLHLVEELYRTLIQNTFDADTFLPEIKPGEFKKVWEECHTADEKNKYDYCFQKWNKIPAKD
jgi:dihydrofolate reductase